MVKPVPAPPKNANQRIAALEQSLTTFIGEAQKLADAHNRLNAKVNDLAQIVTALVNLGPGAQEVDGEIQARQIERARAESAAAKAAVAQGIADGKYVELDAVVEGCVICGHEETKGEDGEFKATAIDFASVTFESLVPDFQPKFLGQPAGARVEVNDKVVFVVEKIIKPVPQATESEGGTPPTA